MDNSPRLVKEWIRFSHSLVGWKVGGNRDVTFSFAFFYNQVNVLTTISWVLSKIKYLLTSLFISSGDTATGVQDYAAWWPLVIRKAPERTNWPGKGTTAIVETRLIYRSSHWPFWTTGCCYVHIHQGLHSAPFSLKRHPTVNQRYLVGSSWLIIKMLRTPIWWRKHFCTKDASFYFTAFRDKTMVT